MPEPFGEMLDTSPEARAQYFGLLACLTPAERARKVVALSSAARRLARAGILEGRPEATAVEIAIELAARLYGADVARMLAPHLRACHG